jgi:hypothetical protein
MLGHLFFQNGVLPLPGGPLLNERNRDVVAVAWFPSSS